jgi:hypothetical protein
MARTISDDTRADCCSSEGELVGITGPGFVAPLVVIEGGSREISEIENALVILGTAVDDGITCDRVETTEIDPEAAV